MNAMTDIKEDTAKELDPTAFYDLLEELEMPYDFRDPKNSWNRIMALSGRKKTIYLPFTMAAEKVSDGLQSLARISKRLSDNNTENNYIGSQILGSGIGALAGLATANYLTSLGILAGVAIFGVSLTPMMALGCVIGGAIIAGGIAKASKNDFLDALISAPLAAIAVTVLIGGTAAVSSIYGFGKGIWDMKGNYEKNKAQDAQFAEEDREYEEMIAKEKAEKAERKAKQEAEKEANIKSVTETIEGGATVTMTEEGHIIIQADPNANADDHEATAEELTSKIKLGAKVETDENGVITIKPAQYTMLPGLFGSLFGAVASVEEDASAPTEKTDAEEEAPVAETAAAPAAPALGGTK